MVTVEITVEGLAILCLDNSRGEINLLRYDDHNLIIEMENGHGSEDDPVTEWDTQKPAGGLPAALTSITFSSTMPRITGTASDQTPINRLLPPDPSNVQSLRWILDHEGSELHDGPVNRSRRANPKLLGLSRLTIPDAYFYTAGVDKDKQYLVRKPSGKVERFGSIGSRIGAVIYADEVTMSVAGLTPIKMGRANENDFYSITIDNLDATKRKSSDFDRYYDVIEAEPPQEFGFLSIPINKLSYNRILATDANKMLAMDSGPSYECWATRTGGTQGLDDLVTVGAKGKGRKS